jgi:hypothetical protein
MRNLFDKELTAMQQDEFNDFLALSYTKLDRYEIFEAMLRLDLASLFFAVCNAMQLE